MICHNCKQEIVEGSAYCYRCGARQTPAPPGGVVARKRLLRSRRDKKIAGICAGFANYFELDVTLIRIIWLLVALFGGGGLIAYLICWIVVPLEPESTSAPLPATQAN